MKTEDNAWKLLREHGASMVSPGLPDRVLRAAGAYSSPILVSHFAMCAATAALCLVAVALYDARSSGDDDAQSLAGWNDIAAQAGELDTAL
jgi:hypothetical protein